MNKRIKEKVAKSMQQAEQAALQKAPLLTRIRAEIAHGVAEVKQDVKTTVDKVMSDIRTEVAARAPQLEKRAEEFLHKVPVVGDELAEKVKQATA
jgi:gas vesicle protein